MTSNQSPLAAAIMRLLRILAVCVPVLVLLHAAAAQDGTPGYKGKTILDMKKGVTTYWIDTGDGVEPDIAGCHVEVRSRTDQTRTGRVVGEQCRADGLLVETTPAKGEIHEHLNDIGHPYLFDCNAWCVGVKRARSGVCTAQQGPAPCTASARCVCN